MKDTYLDPNQVFITNKETSEIINVEDNQLIKIESPKVIKVNKFQSNDYKGFSFLTINKEILNEIFNHNSFTLNDRGFFLVLCTQFSFISRFSILSDEEGKPLTNKFVSTYLGLNESTVSAYFKKFEKAKILKRHIDLRPDSKSKKVLYLNPNVVKNSSQIHVEVLSLFKGRAIEKHHYKGDIWGK